MDLKLVSGEGTALPLTRSVAAHFLGCSGIINYLTWEWQIHDIHSSAPSLLAQGGCWQAVTELFLVEFRHRTGLWDGTSGFLTESQFPWCRGSKYTFCLSPALCLWQPSLIDQGVSSC